MAFGPGSGFGLSMPSIPRFAPVSPAAVAGAGCGIGYQVVRRNFGCVLVTGFTRCAAAHKLVVRKGVLAGRSDLGAENFGTKFGALRRFP